MPSTAIMIQSSGRRRRKHIHLMYERAQKPMKQSAKPTHMTAYGNVLEMGGFVRVSQLTFMASTGIRCPVVRSSWSSDGDKAMMMLEAQTPRENTKR